MWLWVVLLLCLTGCSRMSDNAELIDIAGMVSEHPEEALGRLGAINRDSLAERDAYYHDFLTLKANDKAYIDHTTDSIILRLLPYYEGEPLYPEVLYYAGRVYSDLGDYPTSLRYFQEALDHIPADNSQIGIKGNILSQLGRLLNELNLYSEAIPYFEQSIEIDKLEDNIYNLAYDYNFLGYLYKAIKDYDHAEMYFRMAYQISQSLDVSDKAVMKNDLAALKLAQNDIDSALILIRDILPDIRPLARNLALSNASQIYLAAGIRDTAYYYATELIRSSDKNNEVNGYHVLFSPEMNSLIPVDSVPMYINRYHESMGRLFNKHESQQAMMQHSMYNYSIQQRERKNAENKNTQLKSVLYISLLIILLAIIIILYQLNRRKKILLHLNKKVVELAKLRQSIYHGDNEVEIVIADPTDVQQLKNSIHQQLHLLQEYGDKTDTINPLIKNSEIYQWLCQRLKAKKDISDITDDWNKIEKTVLSVSPDFKANLKLLMGGHIKEIDYHIALLIKFGFKPTEISILLRRNKTTITYHRKILSNNILDIKVDRKFLDDIIRSI